MRCAAEAARKVVARMRADEENTFQASAAVDPSPDVAIQQQAVPVATSLRGKSLPATDTSDASAADVATRNVDDSKIELVYSGNSDALSDSKAAPPASETPGVDVKETG
uniref:Uncharacterized protein n=1 Tax=Peronospora matthiolae TaxID=2874970 RepID=A0AAV1T7W5_9STRA